jgi:hypothetical protein
MENIESLCEAFNKGVDSGVIRMTVDHDCGHAYNSWSGQLYDVLTDLAENLSEEDQEAWEQETSERLSEDDPGLFCVPEFINSLIKKDGGRTTGNQSVVACECRCPENSMKTVEDRVEYLQSFMNQLKEMKSSEDLAHYSQWFRFDLMEAYIKANQK